VSDRVDIPQTFLDMPRWWHEGQEWLAGLPESVATTCARWNLAVDGASMHGSNALVVPVRREGEPLALRMTTGRRSAPFASGMAGERSA
jgi:streptomycin 6-kinase